MTDTLTTYFIHLSGLIEAMPDALVIVNPNGNIVLINHQTELTFGYERSELLGKRVESLMPDRYTTQHEVYRQNYFNQPRVRPMGIGLELYGKHKDGHEFPVEISIGPLETAEGIFTLAAIRDVTERKRIEETTAQLSAIVEFSDDAIISKDLLGTILSWNKGAEKLFGYKAKEVIGRSIKFLFPPDKQDEFDTIVHKIEQRRSVIHLETQRICKDGKIIPIFATISPIKNAQGTLIGACTTAHDISEQKLLEQKLRNLAEHDALTGLITRRLFLDRVAQACILSKRNKTHTAVFFIDIDCFKQVNDQNGHATGDLLLCAITKQIKQCIRKIDSLARMGGDEFALLLLEMENESSIVKVAKKIMQHCSKGVFINKHNISITLSIGISIFPQDGVRSQDLLEKADAAMYYVKEHGKSNFKLFKKMQPSES